MAAAGDDSAEQTATTRPTPSLLRFYTRLALRLRPFRYVFVAMSLAALVGFAISVLSSPAGDDSGWLMLALVLFAWAVCGLLVIHAFTHTLTPVAAGAPWRQRLLGWLARTGHYALALVMSVLGVMVLVLSFKAIGVITRAFAG